MFLSFLQLDLARDMLVSQYQGILHVAKKMCQISKAYLIFTLWAACEDMEDGIKGYVHPHIFVHRIHCIVLKLLYCWPFPENRLRLNVRNTQVHLLFIGKEF